MTMHADDDKEIPLAVDLDGTLLRRDSLIDLSLAALRSFDVVFPFTLLRGRPFFKHYLASHYVLDLARLKWNENVISIIDEARSHGRDVWLVTAASELLAARIAERFPFTGYKGSSAEENLRGRTKAAWLVSRFGDRLFDYMGDSSIDIHVWAHSRAAYVASTFRQIERVEAVCMDVRRF